MPEQQNAEKIKRTQKDYILAFKLHVVDEEKGYLTCNKHNENKAY